MISNTTLKEIAKTLLDSRSVILFPHENPDGDAIGSCVALCKALRNQGIEAWVLIDELLPELIEFLDEPGEGVCGEPCCTMDHQCVRQPDICVFIDCSGDDRILKRAEKFHTGRKSICIDHHLTAESAEDLYYSDSEEAATAQIIYKLLVEMGVEFDRSIANAIYTGICMDTGNFKYSNTTAESHRIVAELMDIGIDHDAIMLQLYSNVDPRETRLESAALANMDLLADGQAAIACVTQELLQECDAKMEHADHLIVVLRDLKGVEIAAVLKEQLSGATKVSFRAKSYADVAEIARLFGGGGHIRASGCTIDDDIETARVQVITAIEEALS